jgi:SAM-dependent MidA family methyltransferase
MGLANAHYYATRDPLGVRGDFITAPEISQMFGELIGLCLADAWQRAGRPDCIFVELGPGRGTLAADALRTTRVAGLVPPVHFVETSSALRRLQAERVPEATWHDAIATLPHDTAMLIVANEFFDALPIRQYVKEADGWCERRIGDGFRWTVGARAEIGINAPVGTIAEQTTAAVAIMGDLADRLATQGGMMLTIDYGHDGSRPGDTLQAVSGHAFADPLEAPGTRDLTAHVDFGALKAAARGAAVYGPVDQGPWLLALGLSDRAATLGRKAPERADEIATAYRRLTHESEMGRLFKVLGVGAPAWPSPAGFG